MFTYTAANAYQKSLENFEKRLIENRNALNQKILKAIEAGEFSIIFHKEMLGENYDLSTKELLEDFGYNVIDKGNYWIISWDLNQI